MSFGTPKHAKVGLGSFTFERPLAWFVNDGLMVIFFFVVGMEIRREVHHGELSDWRGPRFRPLPH
jgi:Na+:H+ antiporter, NhaA family